MNHYKKPLAVLTSIFFFFGFITCLNDILVPHLKQQFSLSYTQAVLIQFAFFSSYFFVSIPASRFCEKWGYKIGIWFGLCITAMGAFGLLFSAKMVLFPFFLVSFFILAGGITLIQVAANPYVTLLGTPESASTRLNLVQAFNSLGTTVAPLFGSMLILSGSSVESIEKPYLGIAVSLLVLALLIAKSNLPKTETTEQDSTSFVSLIKIKRLFLGCLGIFAYVGAEVSIGSFLISWLGDESVRGFTHEQAGHYVSFYWGGAMAGRFLGTPLLNKFKAPKVMFVFVLLAILGVLSTMLTSGEISQWSILSVGLFNSILFPTIFSQSLLGLTKGQEKASGLLCTSIVGGALIPLLQGFMADHQGLKVSFMVPLFCYFYILYFCYFLIKDKKPIASN